MGDNVKAGINVLLYPGEVIPSNTFIFVDLRTGERILKRRDK
jgi:hypothetical protein